MEEEVGQGQEPKFKVVRVLTYVGTRKVLEDHLAACWVSSDTPRTIPGQIEITEIVRTPPVEIPLSEYPE